jgi:hypothetical protein
MRKWHLFQKLPIDVQYICDIQNSTASKGKEYMKTNSLYSVSNPSPKLCRNETAGPFRTIRTDFLSSLSWCGEVSPTCVVSLHTRRIQTLWLMCVAMLTANSTQHVTALSVWEKFSSALSSLASNYFASGRRQYRDLAFQVGSWTQGRRPEPVECIIIAISKE